MNLIWLLLSFPLAFAVNPPGCAQLKSIALEYESDLQLKNVLPEDEQGNIKKGICNPAPVLAMKGEVTPHQEKFIREYACHGLGSVEARIDQLVNEQRLLLGFKKLKADLEANKENTTKKDLKEAQTAGLHFVNGLNTAKTLEQLLAHENGKLLKQMKDIAPAERETLAQFKAKLKEVCKGVASEACGPKFRPNEEAYKAINELINGSDLSPVVIESWKNTMAIKKKGAPEGSTYSFQQLEDELGKKVDDVENGKLNLSREQLLAIQSLPDFEDDHFALKLPNLKKGLETFSLLQEFKLTSVDLKNRQEFEYRAKASFIWGEFKNKPLKATESDPSRTVMDLLKQEEIDACVSAYGDYKQAVRCVEGFKRAKNKLEIYTQNSQLDDLVRSQEITQNYLGALDKKSSECLDTVLKNEKGHAHLSPKCMEELKDYDARLETIQNELVALYAVKTKIAKQNEDLLIVRHFILNKLEAQNCASSFASLVDCEEIDALIPKELQVLTTDLSELMVVRERPAADLNIDALCTSDKNFPRKELLCAFGHDQTSSIVMPEKKENPDTYDGPVVAPSGTHNPTRDAWAYGVGTIASAIMSSFTPKPPNYGPVINPYMYGQGQYPGMYQPIGIADSILYQGMYNGYGYYASTPGHVPYTAFPQQRPSVGPYSFASSSGNRSPYFI